MGKKKNRKRNAVPGAANAVSSDVSSTAVKLSSENLYIRSDVKTICTHFQNQEEGVLKERVPQPIERIEEKPKIVEKIIEKVVQDPLTLKQLKEIKEKNEYLEIQVKKFAEENLLLENNLKSSSTEDQSRVIQDLQLENKNLTEKVSNYQCILSNTESLLKTLQKSVENEEATWQEKMLEKEEVLRQLMMDKKNLTLRVSELNTSLQKIKQAEEMESELNNIKDKLASELEAKRQLEEELVKTRNTLQALNSAQVVHTNGHHQNEILSETERRLSREEDKIVLN